MILIVSKCVKQKTERATISKRKINKKLNLYRASNENNSRKCNQEGIKNEWMQIKWRSTAYIAPEAQRITCVFDMTCVGAC